MRSNLSVLAAMAAMVVALVAVVTLCGCARLAPVDTSQRILIEAGIAMSDVDAAVAAAATATEDAAIDRAVAHVDAEECNAGEGREACVVRWLRVEREAWYRTAAAQEAGHGMLETWEEVNDAWRESGERPDDWIETVCQPFDTVVTTMLGLLAEVGVDVPDTWRRLLSRVGLVCQVGGALVTEAVGGDK